MSGLPNTRKMRKQHQERRRSQQCRTSAEGRPPASTAAGSGQNDQPPWTQPAYRHSLPSYRPGDLGLRRQHLDHLLHQEPSQTPTKALRHRDLSDQTRANRRIRGSQEQIRIAPMARFFVETSYTVKYIDLDDMTGDGMNTEKRHLNGPVVAADESAAVAMMTQYIQRKHFGCWSLEIRTPKVTLLTDAEAERRAADLLTKAIAAGLALGITPDRLREIVEAQLAAQEQQSAKAEQQRKRT